MYLIVGDGAIALWDTIVIIGMIFVIIGNNYDGKRGWGGGGRYQY